MSVLSNAGQATAGVPGFVVVRGDASLTVRPSPVVTG